MKKYTLIFMLVVPLLLLSACSPSIEAVSVAVEFRLELETPEHIQLVNEEARFEFALEPIDSLEWEVGPLPEVLVVETDASGSFAFGEMRFYEVGIFAYRIYQVEAEGAAEGLVDWQQDISDFHVTVTVEEVERVLVAELVIDAVFAGEPNRDFESYSSERVEEIVFTNQNQITFSGEWNRGIGDAWVGRGGSSIHFGTLHFEPNGEVETYRQHSGNSILMYWELTADGKLYLTTRAPSGAPRSEHLLTVELLDERLILTDDEGARRLFRPAGVAATEELPLIGVWWYGTGADLVGLYNIEEGAGPREITFSATNHTRRMRDDIFSPLIWEIDVDGYLLLESLSDLMRFTFDVTDDVLRLTDEEGNERTWIRAGATPDRAGATPDRAGVTPDRAGATPDRAGVTPEGEREWVIPDYLDYFEIPEGYRIFDNARISGEAFDFIIYELTSTQNDFSFEQSDQVVQNFVIVVKRDDQVFDVIHHQTFHSAGRMSTHARHVAITDLITEVDLDFDGFYDLLIFSHNSRSNMMFNAYVAYLQRDSGFEQATFISRNWETGEERRDCGTHYIENPAIDAQNGVIFSEWRHWSIPPSWSAFNYTNGKFIQTKHLELHGVTHLRVANDEVLSEDASRGEAVRWTERTWINNQWQVEELCVIPYNDGWHFHQWNVYRFCAMTDEPYQVVAVDDGNEALYQRIFGENVFWDINRRWQDETSTTVE